jgi:hypothetical protein
MTNLKHTWPADEFDAVNIKAGDCKICFQGTDEDVVSLEGDVDERRFRNLRLEQMGRWLTIFVPHDHGSDLILKLPRNKNWVVEVFAGKAEIEARGLQARLQIMVGRGDVRVDDCRGMVTVASGQADIKVKHFTRVNMPEPPPAEQEPSQEAAGRKPWDWLGWGDVEWERWGEGLGERLGWWAIDFSQFFDRCGVNMKNAGFSVNIGNGAFEASDIRSDTGLLRISNGNLKIQEACIADLNITVSHGNIDGRSLTPSGSWTLKNTHGNTRLSFASNVSARLDMATRNGNIHSEIPLVRVTRQGPETYYGKRMVGTIGPAGEGPLPEVHIVANHGNIDVDSRSPENQQAVPTEAVREEESVSSGTTIKTGVKPQPETAGNPPVENSPQAVLEALRQGKISVVEAEELLKSMSL